MSSAVESERLRSDRRAVRRGRVHAGALAALVALLLPVLTVTPASAGFVPCNLPGSGTTVDPYKVEEAAHLALVGVEAQASFCQLDAHYLQTADITMPAGSTPNHTPIGDDTNPFAGVYDGGGFSITGLKIDTPNSDYVGLFGYADDAVLTRIVLEDVDVKGKDNVGGLVGFLKGENTTNDLDGTGIAFVRVTGQVQGDDNVGGLAGAVEHAGSTGESIAVAFSSAAVDVTGQESVGGLVGASKGQSYTCVHGPCFYFVDILGYATGDVSGDTKVGGLVGDAQLGVNILLSHATGKVTGNSLAGGLVGDSDQSFVEGSFFDSETTGQQGSAGGAGRSTGQMKTIFTFADADWPIVAGAPPGSSCFYGIDAQVNDGYPFFLWEKGVSGTDPCITPSEPPPSVEAALVPAFGVVSSTTDGFTVPVENFDADFTWDATVTAGAASIAGGVLTVSGLGAGVEVTATVTTTRDGYRDGSATVTGSALEAVAPVERSFVAPGGVVPSLPAGSGEWVREDGSRVPLTVSSPGEGQVRFETEDGVRVTFTGAPGTDAASGLVADPAGEIVCEVCVVLAAGGVIDAWMFSVPRLVGSFDAVAGLPCQQFSVSVVDPVDGGGPVSGGAHTLQLVMDTPGGVQALNVGVMVGGPVPTVVPSGEGPAPVGLLALGLVAAAGGLLAARRPVVTR